MTKPLLIFLLSAASALANSRSVDAIMPPSPDSIVAFTNGLPPATGEQMLKSREDIMRFLTAGTLIGKAPTVEDQQQLANPAPHPDGVFLTKDGTFYYWTLISPDRLWLRTPEGGGAILQLRQP